MEDDEVRIPSYSELQEAPPLAAVVILEVSLRATLLALELEHPEGVDFEEGETAEHAYAMSIKNLILALEPLVHLYRREVERRHGRYFSRS